MWMAPYFKKYLGIYCLDEVGNVHKHLQKFAHHKEKSMKKWGVDSVQYIYSHFSFPSTSPTCEHACVEL